MNESEFIEAAAAVFNRIESALDDSDVDCSLNEGVLELELDNGSSIIISRHVPNREIWLAARSGGFHYRWQNGDWCDTRGGPPFFERLVACIRDQGGGDVTLAA